MKKKLGIVLVYRFSERNLLSSGFIEKAKEKFEVSLIYMDKLKQEWRFTRKFLTFLDKILYYRFSEIHQFKKHLYKKEFPKQYVTSTYDTVNFWYGFPFPR